MQTIPEFIEAYGQPLFTAMHPTGVEILLFADSECNYHLATDSPRPDKPEYFLLDALLNRIAELEGKGVTIQSAFAAMNEAAQDFGAALSATGAGRVPLMEGYYALTGKAAIGWVPTAEEADGFFDNPRVEEVGQMRLFPAKTGKKPPIEAFEALREAYYANQQ